MRPHPELRPVPDGAHFSNELHSELLQYKSYFILVSLCIMKEQPFII